MIGIGFSNDIDAKTAAREAAIDAKAKLGQTHTKIDFAFVFSTIHYPPNETIEFIETVLKTKRLIGCSTAGIILPGRSETRGISVIALASDEIHFGCGRIGHLESEDLYSSGLIFGRQVLKDFGTFTRQVFCFFLESRVHAPSPFLKGLQEIMGNVFPMIGGGSCDDFNFSKSFQIFGGSSFTNGAVGLLLGSHGGITIGIGGRHGWRPLGKPRFVDESQGNIIKTISGKRAASLYEEYFEKDASKLAEDRLGRLSLLYPLGIKVEDGQQYLLRNVIEILKDGSSIVCQGDTPQGSEIHIMIGNKDSCQTAAVEAAQEAKEKLGGRQAKFVIVIESLARLKLLGRSASKEISKIQGVFGEDVPLFGMYSHGEIFPFRMAEKYSRPHFQNETVVILAVG